jgi:thymidylate synthase (FAD)
MIVTRGVSDVRYYQHMGSDDSVVQCNQSSIQHRSMKRTALKPAIFRAMRHNHISAFQHAALSVEVECPIFTARQWMRHSSIAFNELSLRYDELPEGHAFAFPQWASQDTIDKQMSGESLPEDLSRELDEGLRFSYERAMDDYKAALAKGASREQARQCLPVGAFTHFYATASLRDWLFFCKARMSLHAQREIRELAEMVWLIMSNIFPLTTQAFDRYHLKAASVHLGAIEALKTALGNLGVDMGALFEEIEGASKVHSLFPSEAREIEETLKAMVGA